MTVRLGHIALSFHAAAAAVIEAILERLGHKVETSSAPHAELFERLGRAEIDVLCSAWLPASHGVYFAAIEPQVAKLAVLYKPYCIWGVPDYVPASAVHSVSDLKKPDVAARTSKLIQGINPGAGISRFSQKMIDEYGLAPLGYYFRPGTEAECFGRFEDSFARGEWFVIPLWHPQWLHHQYNIRALHEPKGLLGGQDNATLIMRRAIEPMLSPNLTNTLKRLNLGNSAVTKLDYAISKLRMSPRDAAERFLREDMEMGC